jgi:predicted transcriptional regulator
MSRTLHVTIQPVSDRSDLEADLAAIDAGETIDPQDPTLAIEDLETFGRIFRGTTLELLEAIVATEPSSIRELADAVDRHPPDVLANVRELEDYGLLELEQDGRAKRPVIWYDHIDVDIPLGDRSVDPAHA